MKPEMLDALLLDRALGELSPEVAALLDFHLARNPGAARRAAEFSGTLALARTAVATPRETPRPLDVTRLRREQHRPGPSSRAAAIFRLAACVTLGLGIGWFARPAPKPPVALASAPPAVIPPRAQDPATQFWSIARFAPDSAAPRARKDL